MGVVGAGASAGGAGVKYKKTKNRKEKGDSVGQKELRTSLESITQTAFQTTCFLEEQLRDIRPYRFPRIIGKFPKKLICQKSAMKK